jgi:hypothetical protein
VHGRFKQTALAWPRLAKADAQMLPTLKELAENGDQSHRQPSSVSGCLGGIRKALAPVGGAQGNIGKKNHGRETLCPHADRNAHRESIKLCG